jgi:hypothetical protein
VLTGSCLCGGIRYEIDGELDSVVNCHCSMCRKAQGSAFRTRASVAHERFRIVQGKELVAEYQSSPSTVRRFCRVCGSPMMNSWKGNPGAYGLALGTLDQDPGAKPVRHLFVASKAPWHSITDGLPQYETEPHPLQSPGKAQPDKPPRP